MPRMSYEGRCRSCGAPVFWLRSLDGDRLAPIDTTPLEAGGTVYIDWQALRWRMATADERAHIVLHTSHFATCPQSAQHRRKKVK